jgi:hypothetical protein
LRLALFASRHTLPELRALLPAGAEWTAAGEPGGVVAIADGRALRIAFGNDRAPTELVDVFAELAPTLARLPDSTTLELACTTTEDMNGVDPLAGIQRYRGTLRGGAWQLAEAYPPVDAGTLRRALELAAEIESGTHFAIADEAEGAALLAWAKANFLYQIEDHPAAIGGSMLRIDAPHRGVLALYGSAAFAVRFGAVWPVADLSDDDEESEVEVEADSGGPPRGVEVLVAPSGRRYVRSDVLLWSDGLANRVRAEEPALTELGFVLVADLLCEEFANVVVRA